MRCLTIFLTGCSFFFASIGFCTETTYGTHFTTFEEAAAASASTKPTPEMIMDKVDEACTLLQDVGLTAGFEKLKNPNGGFAYAGTYVWVHDLKNVMRMHPISTKLEGQNLLNFKDVAGKRFFLQFNITATKKGSGWVSYMWPKPGEVKASKKISFVKKCTVKNEGLVVASGVYDLDESNLNLQ